MESAISFNAEVWELGEVVGWVDKVGRGGVEAESGDGGGDIFSCCWAAWGGLLRMRNWEL